MKKKKNKEKRETRSLESKGHRKSYRKGLRSDDANEGAINDWVRKQRRNRG